MISTALIAGRSGLSLLINPDSPMNYNGNKLPYSNIIAPLFNQAQVNLMQTNELSVSDLQVSEAAQQKMAELIGQVEDDIAGIRIYAPPG